jgi:hypothetical protein
MEEILRDLEKSETLRRFLKLRSPVGDGSGCAPNCKWILEDLEKNGRLTGYPSNAMGGGTYPVEGKILHLAVELRVEMMIDGVRVRTVRDLLPFIQDRVEELEAE